MVKLISFATPSFWQSAQLLKMSSLRHGVDSVTFFSPRDLRGTEFWKKNEAILSQPRGAGYWIWKPYLILKTLSEMNSNDVLIYCDAGIEVIRDLAPLVEIARNSPLPVLVSDFMRIGLHWTKRDCFVLMNADEPKYYSATQVVGGFNLHRNTPENVAFCQEWLAYMEDPRCSTDLPSTQGLPELEGYRDHRHDQAVLSILAQRHGIPVYRDPSRYADAWKGLAAGIIDHPDYLASTTMAPSPYDTLIDVHRLRNKKPAHVYEMARRMLLHLMNKR